MLRNKYGGNLGNHLFQYFAAKLLAEKYDLYLDVDPIKGFPETFNETSGCKINDLHKVPFTMSSYEKICWFHVLLNKKIDKCFMPVPVSTWSSAWSERLIYRKQFDLRIDESYMEYIYDIPRYKAKVAYDEKEWFTDELGFKNSWHRNGHLKVSSEETLGYHSKSKYRFLKILKKEV